MLPRQVWRPTRPDPVDASNLQGARNISAEQLLQDNDRARSDASNFGGTPGIQLLLRQALGSQEPESLRYVLALLRAGRSPFGLLDDEEDEEEDEDEDQGRREVDDDDSSEDGYALIQRAGSNLSSDDDIDVGESSDDGDEDEDA
jgi:hypothetical protein